MKKIFQIIPLIILLILSEHSFTQNKKPKIKREFFNDRIEQRLQPTPELEFENIISGLSDRNLKQITRYLASQVYLSLRSGERGYYSSNQAYYLLDNFFVIYEPIRFQVTSKMIESSTPYLSGILYCKFRGSIESMQLYLNLSWNGSRWEITQISVN